MFSAVGTLIDVYDGLSISKRSLFDSPYPLLEMKLLAASLASGLDSSPIIIPRPTRFFETEAYLVNEPTKDSTCFCQHDHQQFS